MPAEDLPIKKVETVGLSPKVLNPALALIGTGVLLLLINALALGNDPDVRVAALSAIASGIAGLGIGYRSTPGAVVGIVEDHEMEVHDGHTGQTDDGMPEGEDKE